MPGTTLSTRQQAQQLIAQLAAQLAEQGVELMPMTQSRTPIHSLREVKRAARLYDDAFWAVEEARAVRAVQLASLGLRLLAGEPA